MHMYTHDRLWPQLADLCALLGSETNIIDPDSGGNCFDEACSSPWAVLADKFPEFPIPMACQSTTVELRGLYDVRFAIFLQPIGVLIFTSSGLRLHYRCTTLPPTRTRWRCTSSSWAGDTSCPTQTQRACCRACLALSQHSSAVPLRSPAWT